MKRASGVKYKTFFLILQVLFARLTKQISENVVDTTFKLYIYFGVDCIYFLASSFLV